MITKVGPAIHRKPVYKNPAAAVLTVDEPVRVMAIKEGWAMVRHKGSIPYVARISDLYPVTERLTCRAPLGMWRNAFSILSSIDHRNAGRPVAGLPKSSGAHPCRG